MTERDASYGMAGLTPPAILTPELVRDIRRRAERRDRGGWEYTTVAVEAVYALTAAAEGTALGAVDRERDDALFVARGLRHEMREMRTVVRNLTLERDRLGQAIQRAYNFVAPELEGPPKPYPPSPAHNAAVILRAALSSIGGPDASSPAPGPPRP